MNEGIPLTGGRVTKNVTKIGKFVHRPCCNNSSFVHNTLLWKEKKNPTIAPHFIGIDDDGREIITFLEGYSPDNLGNFSNKQLYNAGKIINNLHNVLSDFPDCKYDQTVCHNDLSPCNFMFQNDAPYAVFDWDTAEIGDPMNDLAYSIWMWCDIGNREQSIELVNDKINSIMDGYGIKRFDISDKIIEQMERHDNLAIGKEEWVNFRQWVKECKEWVIKYKGSF
jgi:tRNA A-37 threonylcarbamoyl transferase component Bud32